MTGKKLIQSINEFNELYNGDSECIIRIKDGDTMKDFSIEKIFAGGQFKNGKFNMDSIIIYSKGE